jgi:microsomal dipeptidase-like Zn-dependent dipeptidase
LENELFKVHEDLIAAEEHPKEQLQRNEEYFNEKAALEKKKLSDSLAQNDTGNYIKSLIKENEEKLKQQKKVYEDTSERHQRQLAAKLVLLTKQYENRLRHMTMAHQTEIVEKNRDLKFEVPMPRLNARTQ